MSINAVTITGNLTKDIDLRTTQTGMAIGTLSIAVNERKKQGDSWVDYPNYIEAKLFGRRAESLASYLNKGTKVAITGKLHQDRWEKDGQKRSKLVVNIDDIDICGGKKAEAQTEDVQIDYYDESIPF